VRPKINKKKINPKQNIVGASSAPVGRLLRKFVSIVGAIVGVFVLVASVAAYGYVSAANRAFEEHLRLAEEAERSELEKLGIETEPEEQPEILSEDDLIRHTTALLVGLDVVAGLTDALMVGVFNHDTMEITLISLPRDTYIQLSSQTVREMQAGGGFPPSNGITRLGYVHSHGRARGIEFLQAEVEGLLGFRMDYYVKVETDAFRTIVDTLGGVEMEIRPQGLFYSDPYQNLRIAIPGGVQHLDGEMAEGLVRFRSYPLGDITRNEVQRDFMEALFSQAFTREAIASNAVQYLTIFLDYVETNFGILNVPRYARYVGRLNEASISTFPLPGNLAGRFFTPDYSEIRLLTQGIFFEDWMLDYYAGHLQDAYDIPYEELDIMVLNGGSVSGLATRSAEMLREVGFLNVNTGDFGFSRRAQTRIIAHNEEHAALVAAHFPQALVEATNPSNRVIIDSHDVVVIIGLSER